MEIDKNKFFREAVFRICSSLDLDVALKRFLEYLENFMPVTTVNMGLYDPKHNVIKDVATASNDPDERKRELTVVPGKLWSTMLTLWRDEPEIKIINDIDDEEPMLQELISLFWSDTNISIIKMDLQLEEERLGVLTVNTKGKHRYRDFHTQLIGSLHEPFAIAMSNILKHMEVLRLKEMLADDNKYLHKELLQLSGDKIVGAEFGLQNVMEMVRQVAPLGSPVLLLGETGVGKEVIANALHYSSQRKGGPFIKVNCGAIPESLMDSELFGHEKGSFTGAINRKRGRFERAHTGTLFLDEIGELPWAAQVKLLRVLQNKEVERVGGAESIPVDVRIISATNRKLEEMVDSGDFRRDLWYRLNVFPITIPALRHRKDDIPALVQHFIQRKSMDLKVQDAPALHAEALHRLKRYDWPGNVRELENMVERELIQCCGQGAKPFLTFDGVVFIPESREFGQRPETCRVSMTLDEVVADYIKNVLRETNGKVEGLDGAAKYLNLHPSTLRGKMRKLGIPYGRKTRPRCKKDFPHAPGCNPKI